jgi:hypothetical protein
VEIKSGTHCYRFWLFHSAWHIEIRAAFSVHDESLFCYAISSHFLLPFPIKKNPKEVASRLSQLGYTYFLDNVTE